MNPAPVLGSVPPLSGPLRGPPSGTTGHPSPSAPPPARSGPPCYHGPPALSPSGLPTPDGFPTPPPGPSAGIFTGSTPFLHGIDWREHRINPMKLEDNVMASTYLISIKVCCDHVVDLQGRNPFDDWVT